MKKLFSIFLIIATINTYGQKISDLTTATGQGTGGYIPIVQAGTTKKIIADSLAEHIKRYALQQAIAQAATRLLLTDSSAMLDPYKAAINAARALANANATAITGKQDILVSGTSLKTINGTSLLGSGNITISSGGGGGIDSGAYRSITHPNDTTFVLVRSNGLKDTIVFSIGATPVNLIAGTNVTITGTYPNLTIAATPANNGWGLTANTIANPSTSRFGTVSNNSINFTTNNLIRARLDSLGRFAIGGDGLSDGDMFEVKSGHMRVQNRIRFGDGSGFTIEDRLFRSYGGVAFFDISAGRNWFEGGAGGVNMITDQFNLLQNNRARLKQINDTTFFDFLQYNYGSGQNVKIGIPDFHYGGNPAAVMGNLFIYVGKSSTSGVFGNLILGHDGISVKGRTLVAKTTDDGLNAFQTTTIGASSLTEYADNAAAITAGLPVGSFYRTGDLLKVVH